MTQKNDSAVPLVTFREAYELYENGKHRRYGLLFAVNGGALAIAKLLGENKFDLGHLRLPKVGAGMILFTVAMVYDIYAFGDKWRKVAHKIDERPEYQIFTWKGLAVLLAIGLLLCLGWALATWQS